MARILTICLIAILFTGCSENFGPAPPDGGRVVRVGDEGFTGPRTDRLARGIGLHGDAVMVATDAGLFGFRVGRPAHWVPMHGGYLTPDGIERPGDVQDLQVSEDGRRVFCRGVLATFDALLVSADAGATFSRLERPDALLTSVDAIGIAPPGVLGASGAWLAAQGGQVFEQPVGGEGWEGRLLPRAPQIAGPLRADAQGRLAFGVASPTASDFTCWTSPGPGEALVETGLVLEGPALALEWVEGELFIADANGIRGAAGAHVTWNEATVEGAAITGRDWALVGRRNDGAMLMARGSGPGVVGAASLLPRQDPVDVALSGGRVRVLFADGSSWDGTAPVDAYAGVETDLFSLAVNPDGTSIALGHFRTGEIHQGPVEDPDAFSTRGTPLQSSAPRSVRFDPVVDDAVFVGSFGVYRSAPMSAAWEGRNTGFSSYDPFFFAGPFPVSAFVILGDEFWVGGINGDGPYRSSDRGVQWERVHGGLGVPGSYSDEHGLPLVTQVQGFARGANGTIWMAGFRGGAFRLDATTDEWVQESSGLPGLDGVPTTSCCPVPGESEVDLRDIVATADGALLAATGWGVFRLEAGQSRWEERSAGLFNRDVQQLLRHPDDSATVVAATRGRPESPDWLFLTEDGGQTWFPVRGELSLRNPIDLAWSDPARLEIVVLLDAQGAWRMELKP